MNARALYSVRTHKFQTLRVCYARMGYGSAYFSHKEQMMQFNEKVQAALHHVHSVFPEVTQVFYGADGR